MLSWWQGLILGLVQGLTEFLPVSSSGHLVLAERLVGFQPQGLFFEILVHVATLLAVFIVYRQKIASLLAGLVRGDRAAWRYSLLILLASVPAAVAGILFRDYFESTFHSATALGWQFIATGLLLWSTRFAMARPLGAPINAARALLIGIGQAVAIIPAISRSGTTIVAALWSGIGVEEAAEFSFLMAIVVIGGSGVLELRHIPKGVNVADPGYLIAFAAALVGGLVAIRFLVSLLRHRRFHLFAPYCIAVGVFCLVWFGMLGK